MLSQVNRTVVLLCSLFAVPPGVQATSTPQEQVPRPATPVQPQTGPVQAPPADYVIGTEDTLGILFWGEEAISGDAIVRPDGKISLPLIHDVQAAGLTPEQLRLQLQQLGKRFLQTEPNVTVVVRQINSRKVFITGLVARPGAYPLTTPTTVLQLIALAGGISEFAEHKKITIIRIAEAQPLKFNYEDVRKGKNLHQNILLKIGDTVVVP